MRSKAYIGEVGIESRGNVHVTLGYKEQPLLAEEYEIASTQVQVRELSHLDWLIHH